MRIALYVMGNPLVELYIGAEPEADPEVAHLEDHTGYRVGFTQPPSVPAEVDLPDRS